MNAKGPYLQRIEMRHGLWFARTVAMNASDQAVAGKPRGAEALLNRGNMLRQQRRYDEALASYEQAITLEPDYADALYNRGICLLSRDGLLGPPSANRDSARPRKSDPPCSRTSGRSSPISGGAGSATG